MVEYDKILDQSERSSEALKNVREPNALAGRAAKDTHYCYKDTNYNYLLSRLSGVPITDAPWQLCSESNKLTK